MNFRKGLVLDANILMRAVLGRRVRELLEMYEDVATFYSPDVCFEDARHYVSQVLEKQRCLIITERATATSRRDAETQRFAMNNLFIFCSVSASQRLCARLLFFTPSQRAGCPCYFR